MAEPTEAKDNPFSLNYNKKTTLTLFRKGDEMEPIDIDLIVMNRAQYKASFKIARRGLSRTEKERLKRQTRTPDFLLDNDGFILFAGSSGLSTFSDERVLRRKFPSQDISTCTWWLEEKTPFPNEFHIKFTPSTTHASIKPAQGVTVTPETFKEMLNCLHWVKKRKRSSEEMLSE